MKPPDVSYARSGDVAIAYQLVGRGPMDIVFLRGITGDLLSTWEQPLLVRHVEGLASCGRVIMLDRRGTGLSDRVREVQSLETTMDDVRVAIGHDERWPGGLFAGSRSRGTTGHGRGSAGSPWQTGGSCEKLGRLGIIPVSPGSPCAAKRRSNHRRREPDPGVRAR